jgi:hypothetical protein
MKHPDRQEWIPFLFNESDPETRKRLARHLEECAECAHEVTGWRRSLRQLDRWRLPKPLARCGTLPQAAFKWALAAVIVLGFGFFVGRLSAPAPVNPTALRAQVEASVRAVVQADLREAMSQAERNASADVSAAEKRLASASVLANDRMWSRFLQLLAAARTEDARSVQALLQQLQERHDAQIVALRKDLETLASTADDQIRQARLGLMELAARSNPAESTQ